MPATEATWRDQKLMHAVFGVSSLAMLAATIWMLAADHQREWKDYQSQFKNEVEPWITQARLVEEQNSDFLRQREELRQAVQQSLSTPVSQSLIHDFENAVREHHAEADPSELESAGLAAAKNPSEATRQSLYTVLDGYVNNAKFAEDDLLRRLKFRRADLDVARSNLDEAVKQQASVPRTTTLQKEFDAIQVDVEKISLEVEDAKAYRKKLEGIVAELRKAEATAKDKLSKHEANFKRLESQAAYQSSWNIFKRNLLGAPIISAFDPDSKVPQVWLPDLTINYNFRNVARFDRCVSCHQGIDATAPGSAVDPAYPPTEFLELVLFTPKDRPVVEKDAAGVEQPLSLAQVYGITLADKGVFHANDVTIEAVRPLSLGAQAMLRMGDVLVEVNGERLANSQGVQSFLIDNAVWGTPIRLKIRRGVPQPFASHPRLDLFVGSLSPHKKGDIGCTVCHDGQGSATAFKWASHSPNSPRQADEWARDHGWFDNHHWIFPMLPQRFAESNCLKCHHEVVELEPSQKFPDPPAPKLVKGYNLVRQYGCFGCHEIQGYNGPDKRIGPDLRTEPNYVAVAQELQMYQGLSDEERSLAQAIVKDPENDAARRKLLLLIETDSKLGEQTPSQPSRLPSAAHKLAALLADMDAPGNFRKVGPSLRYLAEKVDYGFLYNWVREPKDFRPNTRMPQFFGLHDHLVPEAKIDKYGKPVLQESPGLHDSRQFEPVEIRGITEYLLAVSQPFKPMQQPAGMEPPSAERGKLLFQMRGCLACHQHSDKEFEKADSAHGPDLSRIGAKFAHEKGRQWLYSWLREPNHYNPRTFMPNVFLTPIEEKDADGKVVRVTDPAADIAEFLLQSKDWQAKPVPAIDDNEKAALQKLALMHLSQAFPRREAEKYLQQGIPEALAGSLKGDEVELVGATDDSNRAKKQLLYIGRRTISKFGCAGCHDIPGFESAKPIGTALADWGRKDPAKLAFELVDQYVTGPHGKIISHAENHAEGAADHGAEHQELNLRNLDPDTGYFMSKLLHHQREGFLWQKLREPRSYDYRKTETKSYNERLRMPKFNFPAGQEQESIEAIMTFVLGLVSEPPAEKYIYHPDRRQQDIIAGRAVIDKFNCAGCHELQTDRFVFQFDPKSSDFASERKFPETEFDMFRPSYSLKQIEASKLYDARGLGHAEISAWLVTDDNGEPREEPDEDEPDNPALAKRGYKLWEPALINGQSWLANEEVLIPNQWISKHYPAVGGDFARLVHPLVFKLEKSVNPNANYLNAWGWGPPPLVGEGKKVQTKWLHDFLMEPFPIRPAVVLRMPKFSLSSSDARKLANYFAAVDGAEYPYEVDARAEQASLAELKFPGRLHDAMEILTDGKTYCAQCHQIGDFSPKPKLPAPTSSQTGWAPRLDRISRRLRPEYLEMWLASPKRLLPYTGMPENFKLGQPLDTKQFKIQPGKVATEGSKLDQLQAVADLLMQYDSYMSSKIKIRDLVQSQPDAPVTTGTGGQN